MKTLQRPPRTLAKSVEPVDRLEEFKKAREAEREARGDSPGKLFRNLLEPRTLAVLTRRLHQMETYTPDRAADLAKMKGAESCIGGSCALKEK